MLPALKVWPALKLAEQMIGLEKGQSKGDRPVVHRLLAASCAVDVSLSDHIMPQEHKQHRKTVYIPTTHAVPSSIINIDVRQRMFEMRHTTHPSVQRARPGESYCRIRTPSQQLFAAPAPRHDSTAQPPSAASRSDLSAPASRCYSPIPAPPPRIQTLRPQTHRPPSLRHRRSPCLGRPIPWWRGDVRGLRKGCGGGILGPEPQADSDGRRSPCGQNCLPAVARAAARGTAPPHRCCRSRLCLVLCDAGSA